MTELNENTLYFGASDVSKYLKKEWDNLVLAVEKALKSYSAGKIVQPVRAYVSVKEHEGVLFAMPAYNEEENSMATKVVTVYPKNKGIGKSAVQATVLLYSAENGTLKAILDGNLITEMRTAAASVVASKYLAPKNVEILAILGAGAQARSHYLAFSHFYSFRKIYVWNAHYESTLKLVEEIKAQGQNCTSCTSVEDAVKEADIIITATMATSPILNKEWIKHGCHINAIGAPVPEWQELSAELMHSSVIYVDSKEGALAESGDIIISKADIYAEIGEVILGIKEAFPNKTTIFKSLGMAVEDVSAASLIYENYVKEKNSV